MQNIRASVRQSVYALPKIEKRDYTANRVNNKINKVVLSRSWGTNIPIQLR